MPIDYGEGKRGEMLKTLAEPRVEVGKMQEVRCSFSSMIAASTSSSTAPASGWMKEKGREVEEKRRRSRCSSSQQC